MRAMKILIIMQRSNGDVFLTLPLIRALQLEYPNARIDMLVNDDTLGIAKTLPHINQFIVFSYAKKKAGLRARLSQERDIIRKIWRQYDLSINLTASDRSVQYAIMASKNSISAIEPQASKSWWKKRLLKHHYFIDTQLHIAENNCKPLQFLTHSSAPIQVRPEVATSALERMQKKLRVEGIDEFWILHAGAQYDYKIYTQVLRDALIRQLTAQGLILIATGGNTQIDERISAELPLLPNCHNWIGQTSLSELIALVSLSQGYIGMDTLVMHIAASLNKPVFAVFGPTLTSVWSPWKNTPEQKIRIFQADMPCVPCGQAGCDNRHGKSECLTHISPQIIARDVYQFCDARTKALAQ